jgi:hypothetical protein
MQPMVEISDPNDQLPPARACYGAGGGGGGFGGLGGGGFGGLVGGTGQPLPGYGRPPGGVNAYLHPKNGD